MLPLHQEHIVVKPRISALSLKRVAARSTLAESRHRLRSTR
ncbi:hypothetical protein ACCUM_1836 [Candidatus Accumulibacter phosphatis]|uniref:Uncharacterized protein n=1 Tax=Candidatus Accumulibacter phosphatis TaxID=327160 RepID=A0A5S4ERZ6_9PROT|nr:hypothetical protein ACCUM_1836 [Candidatus Accumulibacter phosphatis]